MDESSRARTRIKFEGLHVLCDDDPRWRHGPLDQARAACTGGARVIQLRTKFATDLETLELARTIRTLTTDCGAAFVVNDRFDLALASHADAVHLGQGDIPPAAIPADARARLAIGRSTHTPEQAAKACQEPVDYIAFGPVFETNSKASEYAARGLVDLSAIAKAVAPCPVVAIGGIDSHGLPKVLKAGARGAAVISAVAASADPVAATARLVALVDLEGSTHR